MKARRCVKQERRELALSKSNRPNSPVTRKGNYAGERHGFVEVVSIG